MNIEDVISEDTPEYIALDEFEKYLIIYRIIYLQMMEMWNKPGINRIRDTIITSV